MHSPTTEWPNETYREFMEIVTEYQLSNSCGDRLIKLFNSIKNVDKKLFPKSTKEGRKFIDNSDFPYMKFKKVPITDFQDVCYDFYYQPIINGIKTLLFQPDINENLFFDIRVMLLLRLMTNNLEATGGILQKKKFISIIIYYRLLSMLMQPRVITLVKHQSILFIFR